MSDEENSNDTNSGTFDFDTAFTEMVNESPEGAKYLGLGDMPEEDKESDTTPSKETEEAPEDVPEATEEAVEEEAEEEEAKEESKEEEAPDLLKAAIKGPPASKQVVSFFDGEKEHKIPEASLVEVKIDGKVEKIPFQELRSSYSSKQIRDREYAQAKQTKIAAEQERDFLTAKVADLGKKALEGKGLQAFSDILELAEGVDPLKVIRGIRNELVTSAREYLELSEQERNYLDAKEEAEYNRVKLEKVQQAQVLNREQAVMLERVKTVSAEMGIPDQDSFNQAFLELQSIQKSGQLPSHVSKITPELVGEYYQSKQVGNMLTEVIKEEGLVGALAEEDLSRLYQAVKTFRPDREQLKKTLNDLYGSSRIDEATKNINEKVQKPQTRTTSQAPSNSKKQPKPTGSRIDPRLDWDLV